jgi:uncharacterized RDD family membrane protein YckC
MRQRPPRRSGSTLPALRLGEAAGAHEDQSGRENGRNTRSHGPESAQANAPNDHRGSGNTAPPDAFSDPTFFSDVVFKRILAHLVDTAILLAVMAPLGFFMVVTAIASFGLLVLPFAFAFLALRFLYYVGFTAGTKSATPGMRLLGIELRTIAGGRPDFLQAFLRLTVYYVLVGLLTPLVLLVALFNDQRRALHDMVSETVVVNRLAAAAPTP